jgi:hypothetical protein
LPLPCPAFGHGGAVADSTQSPPAQPLPAYRGKSGPVAFSVPLRRRIRVPGKRRQWHTGLDGRARDRASASEVRQLDADLQTG